jgi:erythromycin esterase
MKKIRLRGLMVLCFFCWCVSSLECQNQPWNASAQERDTSLVNDYRTRWLAENAIVVRSLEFNDTNFADLQPLKKAIGRSRIVLLGEQSHGDGTTFMAKARLIRFLHEAMGFNVLAFESGLYDCHKAWELIQKGENPLISIQRGIFGIWSQSSQVKPLIEYLGNAAASRYPLELAGVDCQITGSASRDLLIDDLTRFLDEIKSPIRHEAAWRPFRAKLDSLISGSFSNKKQTESELVSFNEKLMLLSAQADSLSRLTSAPEAAFWAQVIRGMTAEARMEFLKIPLEPRAGAQERDLQMGENLLWLARRGYPDRKIIVWAATMHSMHNEDQIDTANTRFGYKDYRTMGHVVWEAMRDTVYVLGFTAYEGTAGPVNRSARDIGKASKESLENLMRSAGLENAIINFRNLPSSGIWLRQRIFSRPLGYAPKLADWTSILDGMMFTREMSPSTGFTR